MRHFQILKIKFHKMFLEKLYFLVFNSENMKSIVEEKWRV